MKNLKKFAYLSVFAFLSGLNPATATFTVQVINDGVESRPKNGKVIFYIALKKDEQTLSQKEIIISGWPALKAAWRVTIPDSDWQESATTSVHYRFQLDNGDRLSENGGIVIDETWQSPSITDINAIFRSPTDTHVLSSGLVERSDTQSETQTEIGSLYYAISFK